MIGKIFSIAVIVAAAYWYWSGPYQDRTNPSYEQRLQKHAEDMALCTRGAAYRLGATGEGQGATGSEEECAQRYNLYLHEGRWHSYDEKRPGQ